MRKYIGCGLALVWCMVVAATLFFMCGCGLTEVKYDNQGVIGNCQENPVRLWRG